MAPKMESKIFLITKIEEKGLGCVAQKEIKRGALILREKPCLLQEVGLGSGSYVNDYFADIFKAFEKMNSDQKKTFFELSNCYEQQIEEPKGTIQVLRHQRGGWWAQKIAILDDLQYIL